CAGPGPPRSCRGAARLVAAQGSVEYHAGDLSAETRDAVEDHRSSGGVLRFQEKPMTRWLVFLAAVIAHTALLVAAPAAPAERAARFEGKDTLLRPDGYREWVFVGSSLGLRYDEGKKQPEQLEYKNVYIDPTAYRAYRQTGNFPEGTVLVLETAA